jgi:hypothetical protein
VSVLGNLGHTWLWVLAVGASAVALYPSVRRPLPLALLGLATVWATVATWWRSIPLLVATGVNLVLWVAVVTVVATEAPAATVPVGLLVLAALLPQHGNPFGAVGVACLGVALIWRELSAGRSAARAPLLAPPVAAPTH